MITLEGLTKRYGDTDAVDSLDLTISPRNDLVALARGAAVAS